jgi:tetratricopeptide (TPR) repeat protein
MNLTLKLSALAFACLVFMPGCSSVAPDVLAGRNALQTGRSSDAVGYLERAAAQDPNYALHHPIDGGVLTILGRAYYDAGRDAEARATLEKALARDQADHMARLYLGLALARSGERERGIREIQTALRGIQGQLDDLAADNSSGIFWDPTRALRNNIKAGLDQKTDLPELIASAQDIGRLVDREIDLARRDEINFRYNRNVDNN